MGSELARSLQAAYGLYGTTSSYILILSFSFSKWAVPSLLLIKYVYHYAVHML